MELGRILVLGEKKDAAYAIRNVFDLERYEIEVALLLEVAKAVIKERVIDLIILDPDICHSPEFDLLEFQIDHGLEIPMVVVGGDELAIRGKVKGQEQCRLEFIDADGFRLLAYVKNLEFHHPVE